jgi:hypothetical protein
MKNFVFWMLRQVALVRTDVSDELSASIISVTRIGELGTKLAVTSDRRTLCNMPEDAILHTSDLPRTDVRVCCLSVETYCFVHITTR